MVYMRGTIVHVCFYFVKFCFSRFGVAEHLACLLRVATHAPTYCYYTFFIVALGLLILDALYLSY